MKSWNVNHVGIKSMIFYVYVKIYMNLKLWKKSYYDTKGVLHID